MRDNALFIAGVLNLRDIGGPSVKPPQPASVSKEGYRNLWEPGTGADRYRRSLYTNWRRTSPPPAMVTFPVTLPMLTVAANLVGILGGMLIGVTQVGMTPTYYYTLTVKYLTLKDVLPGIGKTTIFGLIVGTVGCYHGFNTEHGTFGVGQATKTSVVRAILLILIADVFLTKLTILLWP